MKRCKNTEHDDQPIRGSFRVRCTKCRDEFPCARPCKHLDCMHRRGEPPPEWASYEHEVPPEMLAIAKLERDCPEIVAYQQAIADPTRPEFEVQFGCVDPGSGVPFATHITVDGVRSLYIVDGKIVTVKSEQP